MRSRTVIAIVVGAALLAVPAAATGKTNTLKGKFVSDSSVNAFISMKVTVNKKGKPTKVTKLGVTDLNYRCADNTSGKLTFTLPGSFKLKYDKATKTYNHSSTVSAEGRSHDLFLQVTKNGKSAKGTVEVDFKDAAGGPCANGVLSFNAKK